MKGFCRYCGRGNFTGGQSCGRRRCPGYQPLWLGDQRMRVNYNLLVGYQGDVLMVTLTPPGQDRLPWDPSKCRHPEGVKCSGLIGCRVMPEQARHWNLTADRRWSKLHDAAAATVRRKHGAGALALLAYSCELHQRGVLHWHLLLGANLVRERAAAHHYVNNLRRLAPNYGYGHLKASKPAPVHQKAGYLSKYLVKERAAGGIGELVTSGQAPGRPVYVSRRLTAGTRCTMRTLRLRRAIFARVGEHYATEDVECMWALLDRLGAVLEPDPVSTGGGAHAP